MILTIYAKRWEHLDDDRLQITTDCESLREALNEHSPNILIDYLNEKYSMKITPLKNWKKGGDNGTADR